MIHGIIGMAGHIDHGKTALVRALTGVETDRLKEEQERGITIDLGFAPLDLGAHGIAGLIDVPGHERFVGNMLAGAGGIDAVLLVIAADESVKPQTREHFDICRLLGVRAGVIALTKIDLVDQDTESVARQEIAALVRGSFLEGAPVVGVSPVTGAGMEQLRRELDLVLASLSPPPRQDFPRLWIDRTFTVRGFGTVVTGTLLSGEIRVGEDLVLQPSGERFRARRLEAHGREADCVGAGQRAAVNLAGPGRLEPARGMLLTAAGRVSPASLLDVRLEIVGGPGLHVQDQMAVRLHLGTAEVGARLRWLGGVRELAGGGTGYAQLRLAQPLAATRGDRFILRRPSPPATIGGGVVLDPAAVRSRAGSATDVGRLAALDSGDAERVIAALLEQSMERGLGSGDLVRRSGLSMATLTAVVDRLLAAGQVRGRPPDGLLSAAAADRVVSRMLGTARAYHRQRPLEAGIPLQELRTRGAPHTAPEAVDALLAAMVRCGDLAILGERAAASGHAVRPDGASQRLIDDVVEAVRQAGLDPPDPATLLREGGIDDRRAQDIVSMLRSRGELVRIADGLILHREAVDRIKDLLWRRRETEPTLDVASFKDLTATSRRIAIPLLEYLDAERVTVRRGNQRLIQCPPSRA